MITRRALLNFLAASSVTWKLDSIQGVDPSFNIGISDSVISGQMKPEVAHIVVRAMADIFDIPGRPKADFHFGQASLLAKRLQKQEIHLAIMTGIEYGWVGTELPELLPLVTAYTSDIRLKACVLVPIDSKAKGISDLKGQSIVLPRRLQHHPFVYLHQEILEAGGQPKGFFDRALISSDTNEGIESVVEKEAAAILVDSASWQGYQEQKPSRARRIRKISESDAFPTTAVLYHPAGWNEKDLTALKNVLCTAQDRPFTRQILNFWRISKFVPYTAEYQSVVKNIIREIPKPVVTVKLAKE